jgi:DNA/RNA-binding domain of Phe-tRNA-synthetase-like protein
MNNSFSVESKVFEVLPDYCVGVIRASIPNKASGTKAVRELFRKELQQFFHQYQSVALRETKNIAAYRSALQKAGINPNKFMCSIEALSRRVQKDGVLPEIDPIVDLGNAISLKYLLAVGAHDLANAQENSIAVRFSEKGDLFRPMGTVTDEGVPEGELVYVSGHQVKTRRFIWRQSDDGKITDQTTEYLIPLDGFIGVNEEDVLKARDEFASLLSDWFGAVVSTGFITKENNIFKF